MEYNLPHHITSEKDLKSYEDFLTDNTKTFNQTKLPSNNMSNKIQIQVENKPSCRTQRNNIMPETLNNPIFFQGYLKNHIGKLVKVESVLDDRLESRIGTLMDVGYDYIVLKLLRSCCSMLIHSQTIKYITIVHDNDIRKARN